MIDKLNEMVPFSRIEKFILFMACSSFSFNMAANTEVIWQTIIHTLLGLVLVFYALTSLFERPS